MGVTIASSARIDAGFGPAYARVAANGAEFGFGGFAAATEFPSGPVSAWIPGDTPHDVVKRLDAVRRAGGRVRHLFAERYHAPSGEAHKLFTEGHLGTRIHFLAKVQAHPSLLVQPFSRDEHAWLREPVLNRLPLMVWMMGPVRDVRVLRSGRVAVIMLRHRTPGRLSILEWSITPADVPAVIEDRFECTGSDGFLRVNGIWGASRLPRLELHRGALETVKRDLPREFSDVYARAAERLDAENDGELTAHYLEACRLIVER